MAKAVFTHADGSIYDDLPEERYHFPRTYLNVVERAVGDWIVYYEPRRLKAGSERTGGRQAYFAVARVMGVRRDPSAEDLFYADMGDLLEFPSPVPFQMNGLFLESLLRRPDGGTNKGAFGRAARALPDAEFEAIVAAGLAGTRDELGAGDWAQTEDWTQTEDRSPADGDGRAQRRWGDMPDPLFAEAAEAPAPFVHRPLVERLSSRRLRDAAFARQVKSAYQERCAMSGLRILNGGGRPEVQAAHIRPVEKDGPDVLRNGMALSATVHWMFDRGLVSVDDDHSILVAKDRLPPGAEGLLRPERRLLLPEGAGARPHPVYLGWHRNEIFKG